MTIKTLLLGTAAAVAVVGGAQAADLSVAEPVEYVKVCDYFGTGYWYIPGTDTCIKISGYVQEDAIFSANHYSGSHSTSWNFQNEVQIDIDTKSETEYGVLEGLVSFGGGNYGSGDTSNSGWSGRGSNYSLGDDGAFVSLGGFKAGTYQLAAWNPVYAVTDLHGPVNNELYGTFGYDLLDTVQMSWASGGINASVAVSDPSGLPYTVASAYGLFFSDSSPLITGNVGWSSGGTSFAVSGGWIGLENGGGSAWGVDGLVHFALGKDDNIELNGAYGNNLFIENNVESGWGSHSANNGYSFLVGWSHNLSKTLSLGLSGSWAHYATQNGFTNPDAYALDANLVWSPVTNFAITAAVVYSKNTSGQASGYQGGSSFSDYSGSWMASLSAKRSW